MGINVSILTDAVNVDVLTLSKLENAFAWEIELPNPLWDVKPTYQVYSSEACMLKMEFLWEWGSKLICVSSENKPDYTCVEGKCHSNN